MVFFLVDGSIMENVARRLSSLKTSGSLSSACVTAAAPRAVATMVFASRDENAEDAVSLTDDVAAFRKS